MQEKIVLNVSGMTCSSCAQGIHKHLAKKGFEEIQVNFEGGEVEFVLPENTSTEKAIREINSLGYSASNKGEEVKSSKLQQVLQNPTLRFLICCLFTIPLLAHMFVDYPLLHLPSFQFILSTPVFLIGMFHFGRSAWGSVKTGSPNMDVLITMGSGSAYLYSIAGWIIYGRTENVMQYMFFETTATIITLLLLGNLIERSTLKRTQSSLEFLTRIQPQTARKIDQAMTPEETTREIPAEHLHVHDFVLVNTGEKIPADGLIYEGQATIDESMMTGESLPSEKKINDQVLSGTILKSGHLKMIVQQTSGNTVLGKMIDTVRKSALVKPEIQRIGDKVSSWFVPVVIVFAIITFCYSLLIIDLPMRDAMLRSIAVLVISCPCAMGLATPTAVAVGIGRSARNGILIKGGDTLERFSQINTIVFDKTGTLSQGNITLTKWHFHQDELLAQYLTSTLEQYSTHPYAAVLANAYQQIKSPTAISFKEIKEVHGGGVMAVDKDGTRYKIGSTTFTGINNSENIYQVFLTKNEELLASFGFEDQLRVEAKETVQYFKQSGIKTVLLSGDRNTACKSAGKELDIDQVFGEQLPDQKAEVIHQLQQSGKVAMTGDGVNDAAALAIADVGIAVSNGTQITMQTAEIVLVGKKDLISLTGAHRLSVETLRTIKQNLFWALIYNVIAIPLAATGFLSPMIASLSMAFSDVVVIGNSLRLHVKKLPGLK
ncbi:MAG: cadmium-translocating P-type ATPase [Bacteroidia bacterium]|nr:cadmium-translocating P-type ATPase [Bacteroidia bacterium]